MAMDEVDIIHEMKQQDVTDARFITRFVDGERKRTVTVLLTFGKPTLPDNVKIGYEVLT